LLPRLPFFSIFFMTWPPCVGLGFYGEKPFKRT